MTAHAAFDSFRAGRPAPRLVAWGTYDTGKPRVRLLLDALRAEGVLVGELHSDPWSGISDKSVAGPGRLLRALVHLLLAYPLLIARLARRPSREVVLLLYPAFLDIFVVWPLARLRGQTIVFDSFISAHDTVVTDRRKLPSGGIVARLLWWVERAALRWADLLLVDTDQHGDFFAETFGIDRARIITVLVGAEDLFWAARQQPRRAEPVAAPSRYALFYGQFIPLHGMKTILAAVTATRDSAVHWLVVGSGQESGLVAAFIRDHAPANMTWREWVPYCELPALIRNAEICLGIFGESDKSSRVIPNKMFQVLAAGGAIVTGDSPAVQRLAARFPGAIRLVPPADPDALAAAVSQAFHAGPHTPVPASARYALSPEGGVSRLIHALSRREEAFACTP